MGINGLQPQLHPRPHSKFASGQPQKLINDLPPYTVNEIANAYDASGLSVNGSGQKIAIVIDTFPALQFVYRTTSLGTFAIFFIFLCFVIV